MSQDTPEHEMIERLTDGTRQAADCVQEMCRALAAGQFVAPRTLIRLRQVLREASGSAHQLGHAQSNPAFFDLRDQLDVVAGNASSLAMSHNSKAGLALAMLGTALDGLWRQAQRMARRRAIPRADVLAALDVRQKALVH